MIHFNQLTPPTSPNFCLVYTTKKPHNSRFIPAPVYQKNIHNVEQQWLSYIKQQPRTKLLSAEKNHHAYRFEQRSAVFHFPDIIEVKFTSLGQDKTTVYLYSKSVYGYYDFGVNCRRLKKWLAANNP